VADDADKTEEPTGKKQDDARKKGMVAKSADFNSAFSLLMGTLLVCMYADRIVNALKATMIESFRSIGTFQTIPQDWQGYAHEGFFGLLLLLAPVCLGIMFVGLLSSFMQVGWMFNMESLAPDFLKLFSLGGFKKIFSPASLLEILKGVAKMTAVGIMAYKVVSKHYLEYLQLADMNMTQFCHMLFTVSVEVIIKSTIVLLLIGIADLIYQKRKIHKDLKMTKTEVKDESRASEGDPAVKGKIKAMRMQMHKNMVMKELPKATVVITNPTFIAIAIRYQQGLDAAPMVVAKGKRLTAERIRDVAKENGIPLVEDKPLARSLFEVAEVGEEIPQEFFSAVAEILAYVYSLKGRTTA
jgi:flagellar biosynthetic protein FlhB